MVLAKIKMQGLKFIVHNTLESITKIMKFFEEKWSNDAYKTILVVLKQYNLYMRGLQNWKIIAAVSQQ